ncbi:MAG: Mpo1-like protein [Sphingomonadaceae bacterium]
MSKPVANHPPLPRSFEEFWPWYMAAHQDARCRAVHYVGSIGGLVALGAFLATGQWWLIPAGIVFGYACAWSGHFVFERNRPATFVKPWWSFMGDWRMFWMWITGRERQAVALGADLPDISETIRAAR